MRNAILLLAVVLVVALLVGSGVALFAAAIACPTDPGGECRGTTKADRVSGTTGVDEIYALAGDDTVRGGDGDDAVQGGGGADF